MSDLSSGEVLADTSDLEIPPTPVDELNGRANVARRIWLNTEKRRTTLALGAIGVTTTVLELSHTLKGLPMPLEVLRGSGRHLEVGYLSAVAAAYKYKFNSVRSMIGGMLLAGFAGDAFIEVAESITITGFLHNGWANVGGFVLPSQWSNNGPDLGVAMGSAAAAAGREWMITKHKDQNTQL